MVNINSTTIDDDAHKENAIHANRIGKISVQSSSINDLTAAATDDVGPQKPSKSQIATQRKRRVLCELTEAEIQARSSIPCNEGMVATRVTQSNQTTQQAAQEKALQSKQSFSLFKAARQARQKQVNSNQNSTQGSSSDKVNSLHKPQRNLR